jgi:hypothetical protein
MELILQGIKELFSCCSAKKCNLRSKCGNNELEWSVSSENNSETPKVEEKEMAVKLNRSEKIKYNDKVKETFSTISTEELERSITPVINCEENTICKTPEINNTSETFVNNIYADIETRVKESIITEIKGLLVQQNTNNNKNKRNKRRNKKKTLKTKK